MYKGSSGFHSLCQKNEKVFKVTLDGNEIGDEGAVCLAWLIGEKGCNLKFLVSTTPPLPTPD